MSPTIRTEDLIDAHGVAQILSLSHYNTVTTYLKRYPDMPRPLLDYGHGRCRLWRRKDIEEWARKTGRLSPL